MSKSKGTVFIFFCLCLLFVGLLRFNGGLGVAAIVLTAFFLLVKRRYSRAGGLLFWCVWLVLVGGFFLMPKPGEWGDMADWPLRPSQTTSQETPSKPLVVPPIPANGVADLAEMFTVDETRQIAATLMALTEKTDGGQMAVLTIPSLGDTVLEDFSLKVARAWQLGQAEKDNGALLLLVRAPRRTRLEIGLGWEGPIPDGKAGEILDNLIAWEKDGNLAKGVVTAIEQVGHCASHENDAVEMPLRTRDSKSLRDSVNEVHLWTYLLLPIALLLCPLFWLGRVFGRFTDRLGWTNQAGENGGAFYHLLIFILMTMVRSSGRGGGRYHGGGWGGGHGGGFHGGGGHFGGGGASR